MSRQTHLAPAPDAPRGIPDEQLTAREELARSFKAAMASVRRFRGRETREHGSLSDAQYSLLFGLRGRHELSLSELAFAAELSPASATEMLDALAVSGLVRRKRSRRDRRVVLISLTERGNRLIEERRTRFEPLWHAALAEFSDDELLTAAAVLDRMRSMFDAVNDGDH